MGKTFRMNKRSVKVRRFVTKSKSDYSSERCLGVADPRTRTG